VPNSSFYEFEMLKSEMQIAWTPDKIGTFYWCSLHGGMVETIKVN